MSNPGDKIASIRAKLKFPTVSSFVEKYAPNVSTAGIFLKTPTPKPVGARVKFEFLIGDGSCVMRGLGQVAWVRERDEGDRPMGMGIKFLKLDGPSREVLDRVIDFKHSLGGPKAPSRYSEVPPPYVPMGSDVDEHEADEPRPEAAAPISPPAPSPEPEPAPAVAPAPPKAPPSRDSIAPEGAPRRKARPKPAGVDLSAIDSMLADLAAAPTDATRRRRPSPEPAARSAPKVAAEVVEPAPAPAPAAVAEEEFPAEEPAAAFPSEPPPFEPSSFEPPEIEPPPAVLGPPPPEPEPEPAISDEPDGFAPLADALEGDLDVSLPEPYSELDEPPELDLDGALDASRVRDDDVRAALREELAAFEEALPAEARLSFKPAEPEPEVLAPAPAAVEEEPGAGVDAIRQLIAGELNPGDLVDILEPGSEAPPLSSLSEPPEFDGAGFPSLPAAAAVSFLKAAPVEDRLDEGLAAVLDGTGDDGDESDEITELGEESVIEGEIDDGVLGAEASDELEPAEPSIDGDGPREDVVDSLLAELTKDSRDSNPALDDAKLLEGDAVTDALDDIFEEESAASRAPRSALASFAPDTLPDDAVPPGLVRERPPSHPAPEPAPATSRADEEEAGKKKGFFSKLFGK